MSNADIINKMSKIYKGHIKSDSWVERIAISKKFKCGSVFVSDKISVKMTLAFWNALDGHPYFIVEIDEDVAFPTEFVLTNIDNESEKLDVHEVIDVSERVNAYADAIEAKLKEENEVKYFNL